MTRLPIATRAVLAASVPVLAGAWAARIEVAGAPVPWDAGRWWRWAVDAETAAVIAAILRSTIVIAAAYLALSLLAVGVASAAWGERSALSLVRALPIGRRLLAGVLAMGLTLSPAAAGATADDAVPTATMTRVPDAPPTAPAVWRDIERPPPARQVDDAEPAGAAEPTTGPTEPTLRADASTTWVVQPGDHLWSISRAVVAQQTGRPPSESEIARYWQTVIETNRERLPDPDNPDLIHPDMEIELP